MLDAFAIDLIAFFGFGIAATFVANRYYGRLASTTGAVASNKQVLDTFQQNLKGMPRANVEETRRRFRALFSHQQDSEAERLRRIALGLYGATLIAFVAFLLLPGIE
jgi:hypothetical protein